MRFFYKSGLEVLSRHANACGDGRTRVLVFFLGSSFDEAFLRELIELAQDIDSLTGPHCLAVAFTPAPSVKKADEYSESTREYLGLVTQGKKFWRDFTAEMTKNTYAMVNYLGVDASDLPCLAFVNPRAPDHAAVMRLPNGSLRSVYPSIRKLFLDWYGDYRGTLDRWDFLTAYSEGGCRSCSLRADAKANIRENIVKIVVPKVAQQLRALFPNTDPDRQLLERLLKRLRRQPWNTDGIDGFLYARNIPILKMPTSDPWFSRSLSDYMADLYERDVLSRRSAQEELATLREKLPDFPLERVTSISNEITVTATSAHTASNAEIAKVLERLFSATATTIESHHYHAKEMTIMRDQYNTGQSLAVGPNAHVHDVTVNQNYEQAAKGIDLKALASELGQLKAVLSQSAETADHYTALANIAAAENAAKGGEAGKALQHLKEAGSWIWGVANKIGVGLALAAAKTALGL